MDRILVFLVQVKWVRALLLRKVFCYPTVEYVLYDPFYSINLGCVHLRYNTYYVPSIRDEPIQH